DAQLYLHQLRHMRALGDARDASVTIDAAKYATANEWLETNFTVEGASVLTITATGQIDLRPQEPGTIVCGPQGYGPGGFAAAGGPGGFGGKGKKGVAPASRSGILMGRIGENGDAFFIGDGFEGAPDREGKLYLHINPSRYD